MKNTFKLFILFLPFSLLFIACEKDDDDHKPDEDSLAEYFYCDINGVHFNPTSDFNCNSRLFGYYPVAGNGIDAGYLVLRGRDCFSDGDYFALKFFGFQPTLGMMSLVQPEFADSCKPLFENGDYLRFEELQTGHVDFTQFRPRIGEENGLVEGTFECSLKNSEIDSIVNITNGYFRFRIEHTW